MTINPEAWQAAQRAWLVAVQLSRSFDVSADARGLTYDQVALTWSLMERDWTRPTMLHARRRGDRVGAWRREWER